LRDNSHINVLRLVARARVAPRRLRIFVDFLLVDLMSRWVDGGKRSNRARRCDDNTIACALLRRCRVRGHLPTRGSSFSRERETSCTYAVTAERLLEQRACCSAAYSLRATEEEAAAEIDQSPL